MKKLLLLIITVLTLQTSLFGMKRSGQEIEQESKKKVKTSATIQPGAMFYTLKKGPEIILNSEAVALCNALLDISNYSQKDYDLLLVEKKVSEIPFNLDLSDNEVIALFDILNEIPKTARKFQNKNIYLNQDVYTIAFEKINQHNLFSLDFLVKVINLCDFLECPTLLNACTRLLIEENKKIIAEDLDIFEEFSSNSGAIPFLNKHSKRIRLAAKQNIYIEEYNIFDYTILHGLSNFIVLTFYVNFENAKLTSLDGLEILAQQLHKKFSHILDIGFSGNFLELADLTPQNSFNFFPKLILIDLSHNSLTSCNFSQFLHSTKIESINLYNNELATLDFSIFSQFSNLEILNLNDNQLTYFNPNVLKLMPKLKSLNLENNPISEKNKQELRSMGMEINQIRIQNRVPRLTIHLSYQKKLESKDSDSDDDSEHEDF